MEEAAVAFAWVIERVDNRAYWDGRGETFSFNHEDAIRFAREGDAKLVIAWLLSKHPVVAREHGWHARPPDALPISEATPWTAAPYLSLREQQALWDKYRIESDESFTECIDRTIDGWKQRALKAEGAPVSEEREEVIAYFESVADVYAAGHPIHKAIRLLRAPQQQAEPGKEQR